MIHDARRVDAYWHALQTLIRPDSVVADLGAGLGIFSFLACRAGARKVYAIEASDVAAIARELATRNGLANRMEFVQDKSTRVSLPERADLIVSDIGGATPLFGEHIPSIIDARTRFLKPGGTLIPARDTLFAGVVKAPEAHASLTPVTHDLDMGIAWEMAANSSCKLRVSPADLVTAPAEVARLDYGTIVDPNLRSEVEWIVPEDAIAHGVYLWFDRVLAPGVEYSTGPHEPEMIYRALFFPWLEAVELRRSDTVHLTLRADFEADDYIWSWTTEIMREDSVVGRFRQSEFLGEPRRMDRLRKQAATFVPQLSEEGEVERAVLEYIDGQHSIGEIAHRIQARFPSRFPSVSDALRYVAGRSEKYAR